MQHFSALTTTWYVLWCNYCHLKVYSIDFCSLWFVNHLYSVKLAAYAMVFINLPSLFLPTSSHLNYSSPSFGKNLVLLAKWKGYCIPEKSVGLKLQHFLYQAMEQWSGWDGITQIWGGWVIFLTSLWFEPMCILV